MDPSKAVAAPVDPAGDPAVTAVHLTYRYPGAARPAIQDINLSIPQGTFCGIMGANGAGKSTLCRAMTGFIPHFFHGEISGGIALAGKPVAGHPIGELARTAGFVFQNPFDQLIGAAETAFGEVAFGLEQWGVPPDEIERRTLASLADVGLSDQVQRHPFSLSGGQQQRLAIAAVLALNPSILILDEGTSQLDPVGTSEVYALVSRLHQQGKTIVMVEHKLDWLARCAQQALVLHRGRLVLDGPADQVLTDPRLPEWDLQPPTFVALSAALRSQGLWEGPAALTLDQAEAGLRRRLQQRQHG